MNAPTTKVDPLVTAKPAVTPTAPVVTEKPVKPPKVHVSMIDRIKGQLASGVLKNQITLEELTALEGHIKKLLAVLS